MAADSRVSSVEFKGRMLTVTVLRVLDADRAAINATVAERLTRGGALLREMPVVLELAAEPDLAALVNDLRGQGLTPVAVLQPSAAQAEVARTLGLGSLHSLGGGGRERGDPPAAPAAAAVVPTARAPALIVDQPVRSGQQVYAKETDLIVLATVGAGAEVIADGNVHVYGALRGRALAGARGDATARVYCQQFAAELVAVAGCYRLTEEMPPDSLRRVMGKPAQVRLDGEALRIEPIA